MIELHLAKPLPITAVDWLNRTATTQWECQRLTTLGINTPIWRLTVAKTLNKQQRYELLGLLETTIPDFEGRKLING